MFAEIDRAWKEGDPKAPVESNLPFEWETGGIPKDQELPAIGPARTGDWSMPVGKGSDYL